MTSPTAPATPDAVASPCVSVCVMLPEAGVCAGCFRTLDEIAAWSMLDVTGRRAVLAALPARRERWEALARSVRPGVPERDR
jgi:predicted Fe-S protein YdhL (DUF1289 family)